MLAFRFLGAGAVSALSRRPWPTPQGGTPGAWVGSEIDATRRGVIAYRARDLPHWLDRELWEVELREPKAFPRGLCATEARLLRQIPAWNAALARDFGASCVVRLKDHAAAVLRREGCTALAERVGTARADDPTLGSLAAPGLPERAALAVGYLSDASIHLGLSAFGAVAYIAHVASLDPRVGVEIELPERQLQAQWLCQHLSLAAD